MKTFYRILFLILTVFLIKVFFTYKEEQAYLNEGQNIINKIEDFRMKNKRLPSSLIEIGEEEPMGKGPYYEKKDSTSYIIYFNIGFDNTKIYFSETKKWQDIP